MKPIEVRSFIGAPFHSIQDRQTGPTTCRNQLLNSTNHLMALPIIWWFLGLAPFRMQNKNNLSFRFPNEKAIERAGTFQFQSGPPATYLYIYIIYTCGIGWIEDADFWNLNVFTVACCVFIRVVKQKNGRPKTKTSSVTPGCSYTFRTTVDGRNPANQLRLVVEIPLLSGFRTCQVVVWDFFHQRYFIPWGLGKDFPPKYIKILYIYIPGSSKVQ